MRIPRFLWDANDHDRLMLKRQLAELPFNLARSVAVIAGVALIAVWIHYYHDGGVGQGFNTGNRYGIVWEQCYEQQEASWASQHARPADSMSETEASAIGRSCERYASTQVPR